MKERTMGFLQKLFGRSQPPAAISTSMRARGDDIQTAEEKAVVRAHMEEEMEAQRARRAAQSEPPKSS
jgi:hypothetical protein